MAIYCWQGGVPGRRCHLQRCSERAAGKARAWQKSRVALQSLANMPEGFISEGRLSGNSDPFLIHMELLPSSPPKWSLQRETIQLLKVSSTTRCFFPLTHGSEGVQCSWSPTDSCQAPCIPLIGWGNKGLQGMGHGGTRAARWWGHQHGA